MSEQDPKSESGLPQATLMAMVCLIKELHASGSINAPRMSKDLKALSVTMEKVDPVAAGGLELLANLSEKPERIKIITYDENAEKTYES